MLRAWDRLVQALACFSALLLGGMTLYVSYDVAVRYFLNAPTSWSTDLTEYTLVWATFLAAPWLVSRGGHVRIDLLCERLPQRTNRALSVAVSIAACLVCVIGAWQTGSDTWDYYQRGITIAKTWAVPKWLPYAAMPIGFSMMAIEFLRVASRVAHEPRPAD